MRQTPPAIAGVRASSVTALMRRRAAAHPSAPALVQIRDEAPGGDRALTYAELDDAVSRLAAVLAAGFPLGTRMLVLYPTGIDFLVAFFACLRAGMVAVPAPVPGRYRHERRRLAGIGADAGVGAVLTDAATSAAVADWLAAEEMDLRVLITDADLGDTDGPPLPEPDTDTLALLQYTSGSTGSPKGVMVSHGNMLHNAAAVVRGLGLSGPVRAGGWVPLYHDMGLMAQTMPALFSGGCCVLMSASGFLKRPVSWLRAIHRHEVAVSFAPDFAYELCVQRISDEELVGLDLSGWRHAVDGAEPVRHATLAAFADRFRAVGFRPDAPRPCYGLAEATVFVSGVGPRPPVVFPADRGWLERGELRPAEADAPTRDIVGNGAVRHFDVRVVDPATGAVLPDGRVGEIWLRGPSVAGGYWRDPAATAAVFGATTADGDGPYLRTGDLGASIDGELYPTGRIKDVMLVRGRTLHPHDIEHELRLQHDELGGLSGAVFTVGDDFAGDGTGANLELVVAHEVRGRPDADRARLLAGAMRHTVSREFGVSVGTVVLLRRGAVRKTTSGKVERAAMRELYLAGGLDPVYATPEGAGRASSVRAGTSG